MKKKRKIMVVDDEDDIRYVLRRFLEDAEYEVIEASGGPQCFEMIEKEKPDLILLDILMLGMNGWEVCRVIKEHKAFDDVPVSMLSVLSDTADTQKSLKYALADKHLTKPIDFPILLKTVKNLIKEYNNRPPGLPKKPKRPSRGKPSDFFSTFKFDNAPLN
jgi:putative two-component system response regulator